ncbi:MAG: hypothetical protein AAF488_01170 [Planctomycetota bacterium]
MIRQSTARWVLTGCVVAWFAALSPSVHAVGALFIPSGICEGLAPLTLTIEMDNTGGEVQGFALAIGYNRDHLEALAIDIAGTETEALGAELVVGELFPAEGGVTLGVVLDAVPPFDGQTFPIGTSHPIANLTLQAAMMPGNQVTTEINFVDDTFGSPAIDNVIVMNGDSFSEAEGLVLDGNTVFCNPPNDELAIEPTCITSLETGPVRILMSNSSGPVQGFVIALVHDGSLLELSSIDLDGTVTDAAGAEFFATDIDPVRPAWLNGGTAAVILDFLAPFDGQQIAIGDAQPIVNFVYTCTADLVEDVDTTQFAELDFNDGELGDPPVENILVIGGGSVSPPARVGADVCCEPRVVTTGCDVHFYCGGPDLFVDPDGNLQASDIVGNPGGTVDICFYYTSEENVQGFQLAACFDCSVTVSDFTIEDTILEAIGTEFVNFDIDNDPSDGDGCEFIAGILIDATPPFDNQTAPQTATPLMIGCVTAAIDAGVPCDSTLDVEFCNGADATGSVPIENIAVIDFQSIQAVCLHDCGIDVVPTPIFLRSDCNSDEKVDMADAAAVLAEQLFDYVPECDDACDANDDGLINLGDAVWILNYLFKSGDTSPSPGTSQPGPDPTDDTLECTPPSCV